MKVQYTSTNYFKTKGGMENKTKSKFDHTELPMNFTEMKC